MRTLPATYPSITKNAIDNTHESVGQFTFTSNKNVMLTNINPKLPMSNKAATKDFYINKLGFQNVGSSDYDGYLMVERDNIEIHFFEFKEINTKENYSGVYIRTDNIDNLYQSFIDNEVSIHPNGPLETKPWGQREFALLDPDDNLLTFGQSV